MPTMNDAIGKNMSPALSRRGVLLTILEPSPELVACRNGNTRTSCRGIRQITAWPYDSLRLNQSNKYSSFGAVLIIAN